MYAMLNFNQMASFSSYLFRSGNAEHPSDRFYNTSVEVLPESSHTSLSRIDLNATSDGYVIVGLYILVMLRPTVNVSISIHCFILFLYQY